MRDTASAFEQEKSAKKGSPPPSVFYANFPRGGKGKGSRDTISPEFSFDFEKRSRILIFSPGYASSVYTCLIDNRIQE